VSGYPLDLGACVVEAATAESLELRWPDGHRSAYPAALLRRECPCAACRAERQRPALPLWQRSVNLTELRPVGRYALSLRFSDGHGTGIYAFETLRAMCPCPACRGAREKV
jgi:DUF971 family protein